MTTYIEEHELLRIPAPRWTDTWHPVSHGQIIYALKMAVHDEGLEVTGKTYELTRAGDRMFGTWQFADGLNNTRMMMGIRNSVDKSMAVGICAGTKVMVCSNMAFSGDYIQFRKHTGGLTLEELTELARRAVKEFFDRSADMLDWQHALHRIPMTVPGFKMLTFDAMQEGVFAPSQFNKFIDCYTEEEKLSGPTAYAWHGATTRLNRGRSLFAVSDRTAKANKIITDYSEAFKASIERG